MAVAAQWEVSLDPTFLHVQNILGSSLICQQPRYLQQVSMKQAQWTKHVHYQKVNIYNFQFWPRWINGPDLFPPKITKNLDKYMKQYF